VPAFVDTMNCGAGQYSGRPQYAAVGVFLQSSSYAAMSLPGSGLKTGSVLE
jgi:hypothetical protein